MAVDAATLYAMAGDNARALDCLEKAFADRDPNIPYVGCVPIFDPLRLSRASRHCSSAWACRNRRPRPTACRWLPPSAPMRVVRRVSGTSGYLPGPSE